MFFAKYPEVVIRQQDGAPSHRSVLVHTLSPVYSDTTVSQLNSTRVVSWVALDTSTTSSWVEFSSVQFSWVVSLCTPLRRNSTKIMFLILLDRETGHLTQLTWIRGLLNFGCASAAGQKFKDIDHLKQVLNSCWDMIKQINDATGHSSVV